MGCGRNPDKVYAMKPEPPSLPESISSKMDRRTYKMTKESLIEMRENAKTKKKGSIKILLGRALSKNKLTIEKAVSLHFGLIKPPIRPLDKLSSYDYKGKILDRTLYGHESVTKYQHIQVTVIQLMKIYRYRVIAKYDYDGKSQARGEGAVLTPLKAGDIVEVFDPGRSAEEWWGGRVLPKGKKDKDIMIGYFPLSYVEEVDDEDHQTTPDEKKQMEKLNILHKEEEKLFWEIGKDRPHLDKELSDFYDPKIFQFMDKFELMRTHFQNKYLEKGADTEWSMEIPKKRVEVLQEVKESFPPTTTNSSHSVTSHAYKVERFRQWGETRDIVFKHFKVRWLADTWYENP
ncbi:MAG: hypothetical protein CMK44_01395 [Porticoccus sp.]|nr:hypothetical protein [Porticoccus sp.]